MLSKISQSKTNILGFHSHTEFKKQQRPNKEVNQKQTLTVENNLVTRGEMGGRMSETGEGDRGYIYLEHTAIFGIIESLYFTFETNITLLLMLHWH